MFELTVIVAVITALSQVVKKFIESRKFMPLVSVGFGILAGIGFIDGSIQEQIFIGAAMGLASSGAFDITKVTRKEGNRPKTPQKPVRK